MFNTESVSFGVGIRRKKREANIPGSFTVGAHAHPLCTHSCQSSRYGGISFTQVMKRLHPNMFLYSALNIYV